MTLEEAKILSKKIMESNEIPLLIGHFGVGKTDIIKEIAKETNRKLIILVLSQMEPGDLIGLPSRENNKTVFLAPDWWPEDENTIIFLDEINRSHRSIRNAIMQLLIDKRIHNHILPKGTWIVASMNPPDEEYDQVDLITDPAFLSRFFILEVSPDTTEWINWAKNNNLSDEIIEFIEKNPEFLHTSNYISLKTTLKPSPRSWYKLGNVLKNLTEDEKKLYGYQLASGILGPEAAKIFIENITSNIPTAREVIINGKIPKNLELHDANSLILRIIDFLTNLTEDEAKNLINNVETISKNLLSVSSIVPKDVFFSLVRLLSELSNEPGFKGLICDKILEKISI
ncbi:MULTISPECIES: MoxR family ATPase [unclassified Thermosipho (in: thermotogales)]|uniref:AAA family ATPase n=1 Tax=unclassified Thermosipho (in: thermotogales) TaxID=2676525 RepID=UPI0009870FBF|nr:MULTISPECIES: MoxR family ATPase [unclassified Thermosipho (in: thermotogales)]MBT1247540.1 AAA family ATPase [Thermosipho sp. 1244]OOC46217.1 ATPase AAA [Thermosipho sp. 1223]